MPDKRVRLHPEERHALLLDAAERVFGRLGVETARMEDVAKEAGVAKGLLYQHWTSKEELFFAVMQYKAERFTRRVLERFAQEAESGEYDAWHLMGTGLRLWMQQISDDIANDRWLVAPGGDGYRAFRDATRALLESQIRLFAPTVEPALSRLIAAAVEGAVELLSLEWTEQADDERVTEQEALNVLTTFALRGLDGLREHLRVELPPAPPPVTRELPRRRSASRRTRRR